MAIADLRTSMKGGIGVVLVNVRLYPRDVVGYLRVDSWAVGPSASIAIAGDALEDPMTIIFRAHQGTS